MNEVMMKNSPIPPFPRLSITPPPTSPQKSTPPLITPSSSPSIYPNCKDFIGASLDLQDPLSSSNFVNSVVFAKGIRYREHPPNLKFADKIITATAMYYAAQSRTEKRGE